MHTIVLSVYIYIYEEGGFFPHISSKKNALTFNQSFSHEVVVHGLCHNLGYFITVKFHKAIAFTPAGLYKRKKKTNTPTLAQNTADQTQTSEHSHMVDVGTWVSLHSYRASNKLNEPPWCRHNYLTNCNNARAEGNFQIVPFKLPNPHNVHI